VVHEDDDLVAVSKPPGEAVIPERGAPPEACLRRRLEAQLGRRLWVVHRIDRDASGLVVFAGNAAAHRASSLDFEHRRVTKTYVAFTAGAPESERGTIDVALHPARRGKSRPAREGESGRQEATTAYVVERTWRREEAAVSLLEVRPRTGRRHQIRVHLRFLGTPLLFDPLYGGGLQPPALEDSPCARLALHARRLDLPAPGGGGRLVLEAPLAEDLQQLRRWLEGEWARGNR
jgi:tRNA pseudouridine32 synthase/23S rRNA pseudouridine746 synthase/23S rRNA pseudouridine955/2504/2580 synthase